MSNKIRRSKSKIKVSKNIEEHQNLKHQKLIDILNLKIEVLNSELHRQTYELEYIKSLRDIEQELYSLIILVFMNSDDYELSKKMVALDQLINNLINELLNNFYTSKYSAIQQQHK